MRVSYFMFVCVCLYEYADGEVAPFITPCHATDSACMKASAQKAVPILAAGVPSLGINVMDPMHVDRVATTQAGLEMDFKNTIVRGLRHCHVEDIKSKEEKTLLDLKCSVTLVGDYTLGGQLLVLPIEGKGKYKIKIHDIVVKIIFNVADRKVNGVDFWHVDSWKHSADVKTRVEFQFQNLFNGNKPLSDAIHQFANTRWQDIFHEVAPPIVKAIVSKIVGETTKLFDHVPKSELVLS